MALRQGSTVVRLERATIQVGSDSIVNVPLAATRDVAAQKRVRLEEAAEEEARLLGTRPQRVHAPRYHTVIIDLNEQQ